MIRTIRLGLVVGLLLFAGVLLAADDAPAGGNYKVTILQGNAPTFWLVQLDNKDGKWSAKMLATAEQVPTSKIENLSVKDDQVRFVLKIMGGPTFDFDGRLPKAGGKTILGTFVTGKEMVPVKLEATTLKSLDPDEMNREIVASQTTEPRLFDAAAELLSRAQQMKAKPEDVRGWAEKAYKAADIYGARWQREVALRNAELLTKQEPFAGIALEYARRVERALDAKDEAALQIRVVKVLASALKNAGKTEEAKEADARLVKLELVADQEYLKTMPPFKPDEFKGRKGKSERVVLVELFTGTQCPPCVAADLAFDAMTRTYKPSDVIFLQYHLHIPRPDALTNPDTEARAEYYDKDVEGTPTMLFNGKPLVGDGGGVEASAGKYTEYRGVIDALLEKPARARLKATAALKGSKIEMSAQVSDLDKAGEQVRLRFAVIEEQVRYLGTNGVRFHHHVVRALPGGPGGYAVKDKTAEQSASVDIDELRKTWTKYLDSFAKKAPFPNDARPLDMKKLSVVVFLQDDRTREVLQAVQVAVAGEGSGEK